MIDGHERDDKLRQMDSLHGTDVNRSASILREDGEFTLYRVQPTGSTGSVLVVRPADEHPPTALLERLAHEFALKDVLNSQWAARPLKLVRDDARMVLVLEDPLGELLERQIGGPGEVGHVLSLAVGIAAALGKVHQHGLVHKDINLRIFWWTASTATCGSLALAAPLDARMNGNRRNRRKRSSVPSPIWRLSRLGG